jgi:hypothetical protein
MNQFHSQLLQQLPQERITSVNKAFFMHFVFMHMYQR